MKPYRCNGTWSAQPITAGCQSQPQSPKGLLLLPLVECMFWAFTTWMIASVNDSLSILPVFFYSYEFKVKPKNELGAGPPSEPVSFNTESGAVSLFFWCLCLCFSLMRNGFYYNMSDYQKQSSCFKYVIIDESVSHSCDRRWNRICSVMSQLSWMHSSNCGRFAQFSAWIMILASVY